MALSERQTNQLRIRYLRSLLGQDQAWYDQQDDPATLGARFTLDIIEYYKGTGERISTLVTCLVGFGAGLAVGIWKGWQLALLVLAISPIHGGLVAKIEKSVATEDSKVVDLATEASSIVLEAINQIRIVKTFSGQVREYKRFAAKVELASASGVKKALRAGVVAGLTWLSIFVSYGVAMWFGCWLIRTEQVNDFYHRKITGGDVVTTFWAVLIAAMTLGEIGPCWAALTNSRYAASRLFAIIDRVPSIDSTGLTSGGGPSNPRQRERDVPDGSLQEKVKLPATLKFVNVDFAYPSRPV